MIEVAADMGYLGDRLVGLQQQVGRLAKPAFGDVLRGGYAEYELHSSGEAVIRHPSQLSQPSW